MKGNLRHILVVLAVLLAIFPSCRRERVRVIPRSKLARIYAEMLVTDQWAQSTPSLRRIADTSLVYEPILEKYGYTSEDYQLSVDSYMDDPERFSRILRSTSKILDAQLKDLRKKQHQLALAEKQKKALSAVELPEFRHFMNAVENYRPLDWADSVKIELDTAYFVHKIERVQYTDTVYEGVRMIVAAVDTLAVKDSVAVADTLKEADKNPDMPKIRRGPDLSRLQKLHKDRI
jgi:hypothetical protein